MVIDLRSIKTLANTTMFQLKYPVEIGPNTTSIGTLEALLKSFTFLFYGYPGKFLN